jgi:hypothetical protein
MQRQTRSKHTIGLFETTTLPRTQLSFDCLCNHVSIILRIITGCVSVFGRPRVVAMLTPNDYLIL